MIENPYQCEFQRHGEGTSIYRVEKVVERKLQGNGCNEDTVQFFCEVVDKSVGELIASVMNAYHAKANTPRTHKQVHKELHHSLDLLMADYAVNTGKLFEESSILDLLTWSFRQTYHPDGKYDPHWEEENPET